MKADRWAELVSLARESVPGEATEMPSGFADRVLREVRRDPAAAPSASKILEWLLPRAAGFATAAFAAALLFAYLGGVFDSSGQDELTRQLVSALSVGAEL